MFESWLSADAKLSNGCPRSWFGGKTTWIRDMFYILCYNLFRDIQNSVEIQTSIAISTFGNKIQSGSWKIMVENVVQYSFLLTHWGRVTHIWVSQLTTIGSDNGLSPSRRQAIIWTNAGILLIRPLGTNVNEMLIEILTFSFMKMRLKVSSAKWRPFCLGLNVLNYEFNLIVN